ncbi:MAG: flagellar assembly protein FliW [Desulfovibrionaceae bacterium]
MRLIRTRLGEREIAEDAIIRFPHGLIGFENMRDFVVLQVHDDSPFLLLQSLEDSGLGLLVADPLAFVGDYGVRLDAAEKRILQVQGSETLAILATVSIPKNEPEKTTLNLSGPIVINTEARVGLQSPQIDSAFPPRMRLVDANRA